MCSGQHNRAWKDHHLEMETGKISHPSKIERNASWNRTRDVNLHPTVTCVGREKPCLFPLPSLDPWVLLTIWVWHISFQCVFSPSYIESNFLNEKGLGNQMKSSHWHTLRARFWPFQLGCAVQGTKGPHRSGRAREEFWLSLQGSICSTCSCITLAEGEAFFPCVWPISSLLLPVAPATTFAGIGGHAPQ